MYCFPYPQLSDAAPLRAPYVATHKYSLAGEYNFDSFYESTFSQKQLQPYRELIDLQRQASISADISRLVLTILQPPTASAIQSWLFFGLASEALGRDVEHSEFLEASATGASESSIDLRIPFWFWSELEARWDHLRDTISKSAYKRKKNELHHRIVAVLTTLASRELEEKHDTELSLVILSVYMLLHVISDVSGNSEFFRTTSSSRSSKLLIQRMIENGWCRKRLNFVDSISLFYPAFYFMSSSRPPNRKQDDHRSCTSTKCYIKTGLSEPFHRTNGCPCKDMHVPLEDILRIVAAGGVPLIRVRHSPDGDMSLEVVPYNRTVRFTAISHVWADRQLGSTKNALPTCQIKYLDSVLAALPGEIFDWSLQDWLPKKSGPSDSMTPSRTYEYFWLDTFCIPQDDQHAALRNQAIGSMNLIYAAAAHTLVLDSGLQNLDAGQHPGSLIEGGQPTFYAPSAKNLPEVLSLICASNWMGRAW
jgi:hypothetical protein